MKKMLLFMMSLTLVFNLAACGKKIEYTKEFPYLPSFPGMVLKETTPANEYGFSSATYTIKDKKMVSVADEYEKILNDNGWKTTDNKKPNAFTVEKEDHKAVIVPSEDKNDTNLFILSK